MSAHPLSPPLQIVPSGYYEWWVEPPEEAPTSTHKLYYSFACPTQRLLLHPQDPGGGDITAGDITLDGDEWKVVIPSTALGSQKFTVIGDDWFWQENYRTTGDAQIIYGRMGPLEVVRNLDSGGIATGYDARSHNRKVYDDLKALLENKVQKDQISYSIAGRSVSKMQPDEILRWFRFYETRVRAEQADDLRARGLGGRDDTILMEFP